MLFRFTIKIIIFRLVNLLNNKIAQRHQGKIIDEPLFAIYYATYRLKMLFLNTLHLTLNIHRQKKARTTNMGLPKWGQKC